MDLLLLSPRCGEVVSRRAHNREVIGSNPIGATQNKTLK